MDIEKWMNLKKFNDIFGPIYGSEKLSIFMYSLVLRERPKVVVEVGSGLGVVATWAALALKENNNGGHIWSLDNMSWIDNVKQYLTEKDFLEVGLKYPETEVEYYYSLTKMFDLNKYLTVMDQDF